MWMYLHNDELFPGTVKVTELFPKAQSHCWIWSRNLTLLIELQSWRILEK